MRRRRGVSILIGIPAHLVITNVRYRRTIDLQRSTADHKNPAVGCRLPGNQVTILIDIKLQSEFDDSARLNDQGPGLDIWKWRINVIVPDDDVHRAAFPNHHPVYGAIRIFLGIAILKREGLMNDDFLATGGLDVTPKRQ